MPLPSAPPCDDVDHTSDGPRRSCRPTALPLGCRPVVLGICSANAMQAKFIFKRDSSVRVTVVGGGMDAAAHTFFTPLATPSLN